MMKARIMKGFRFDAAHLLPNHRGLCSKMHGHSYKLEVILEGQVQSVPGENDEGMVVDFGAVKDLVTRRIIERLDHECLNDVLPYRPTAENIARWCLEQLIDLPEVISVRVWETQDSWAEVSRDYLSG